MKMQKYVSVSEAAEILNVHYRTVVKMCKRGDLKHLKIGKTYRILLDALDMDKQQMA